MEASSIVVAIVDDDPAVRRALRRLITSLTYRPIAFASGEEFLTSLFEGTSNCVIMDQHMPSLNGLDVLRRMQSQGWRVPAIIITGFDEPGLRQKCLDAGASCYLIKPLEAVMLSIAIEVALA
jgi:FixJ family two-component response regulator